MNYILPTVALFLIFILLGRVVRVVKLWRYARCDSGFCEEPWRFDNKIVTVVGSIEHIFSNSLYEKLKRKARDAFRDWTNNPDSKGRYVHQRFLLKSPALRRGQCILVEHNIEHGKVSIRSGQIVEVRGEYLHTVRPGSRHFYGRIHFTHAPKGFLKRL